MAAQVGALRVTLGANTAQYEAGMRRAQAQARRTGQDISTSMQRAQSASVTAFRGISAAAATLGIGLAAAGAAFADQARQAIEFASNLGEASRAIGVTVEQYQILNRAAIDNGASMQDMERALGILNRTLGQARAGVPAAAQAFRALRIDPEQFRSAGEVLPVVMDRIRGLRTESEQAAAAQRLFGRSAQSLIPFLVQGAEGYDRYAEAAREAGLVTAEQARRADEAADSLAQLGITIRTNLASALVDVLPYIEDAIRGLIALGRTAASVMNTLRQLGSVRLPGGNGLTLGGAASGAIGNALRTLPLTAPTMWLLDRGAQGRANESRLGTAWQHQTQFWRNQTTFDPNIGNIDLDLSSGGGGRRGGRGGGRGRTTRESATRQTPEDFFANPWIEGRSLGEMEEDARQLSEWLELSEVNITEMAENLPDIGSMLSVEDQERIQGFAESFQRDLSSGLANAIVQGESLGDALVNSFQRAAAALLEAGIFDLLTGQGFGGQKGTGGFASWIGSAVGSLFGGGASVPKFATGGSFMVGGNPGIDRNTLSLNGMPVARVSKGETVGVGWGGRSGGRVEIVLRDAMLDARIEQGAGIVVSRAAPAIIGATQGRMADKARRQ